MEQAAGVQRTVSIITTCKGRLEHLRQSLPRMLALGAHEVIVVDYSCPDGTGGFVRDHHPEAKVVTVEGQDGFSNWRARNVGAAAATGQLLLFCDADTLPASDALARLDRELPVRSYGYLPRKATAHLNQAGHRLSMNQLRGFHVIPARAFRAVGGYDDVLEGWGAGGDTELEQALLHIGLKPVGLDPGIIDSVLQHDNRERLKHHSIPIPISYGAGMLYRLTKRALLATMGKPVLPPELRRALYVRARRSAGKLATSDERAALTAVISEQPVGMPLQLGFRKAVSRVTLTVELIGEERIDRAPE